MENTGLRQRNLGIRQIRIHCRFYRKLKTFKFPFQNKMTNSALQNAVERLSRSHWQESGSVEKSRALSAPSLPFHGLRVWKETAISSDYFLIADLVIRNRKGKEDGKKWWKVGKQKVSRFLVIPFELFLLPCIFLPVDCKFEEARVDLHSRISIQS